ncbi:MAG: PD-(D/E)XK nuclease family protein [Acidimicrobiia bacterium]|nr:PD-(D/E)XK nuclease family protein [Acidimicrobiia bacterium]
MIDADDTDAESTTPAAESAAQGAADALTPVQLRTLAALRRSADPVVFDAEFVDDLHEEMRTAVAHFTERLGSADLFITKHKLASVLDCEVHHLAPDDFSWRPATARGQVSHRAIQLLLTWRGEPTPTELVDEAMARLAGDDNDYSGIGSWIAALEPGDEADLRGQASERVTKFVECFPPLDRRSNPLTESRTRWPVDGQIVLRGQADLTIGRPRANESTKVIIDLKTGNTSPRHRQDLGFYALIETMSRRVPPRKVATFYLDAGEAQTEDVGERLLRTALRRTLDGINALVELEVENRPPVKRPGFGCRWCPLAGECAEGIAHLATRDTID